MKPPIGEEPDILIRLREACADRNQQESIGGAALEMQLDREHSTREAWGDGLHAPVQLSPAIRFVDKPCVVNDCVQLRPAVAHPGLQRPVAFLAGFELVPLLRIVTSVATLGHLVALWSRHVPARDAARIAGWLLRHGLVEGSEVRGQMVSNLASRVEIK